MMGLIDYGAGNMQSVANALEHLGVPHRVCRAPVDLEVIDRMILPGVGHFGAALRQMSQNGLLDAIRRRCETGIPVLGICLGMQFLFGESEEAPDVRGLGVLPGRVVRLQASRVPHMGWNRVETMRETPLSNAGTVAYYYFAHSYVAEGVRPEHVVGSACVDDQSVPVMVGNGNVWGVQFHPEKSADAGLALLRRFAAC